MGFTFRRHKLATGLFAVGHTEADVDIKLDRMVVGIIYAPSWQTKDHKWSVNFMMEGNDDNPNCDWRWMAVKERFDTEEQARQWVKDRADKIKKWKIHREEPDPENYR